MIEKITLDNFKSHAHTEIELGRVTALVGPNGCGKTSVLQAIYLLSQLVDKPWSELRSGQVNPISFTRSSAGHSHISLQGKYKFASSYLNWYVAVGFNPNDVIVHSAGNSPEYWDLISFKPEDRVFADGTTVQPDKPLATILDSVQAIALKNIAYFKADYRQLAQPSYSEELQPQIAIDGSNLASVITFIIGAAYERHNEVLQQLQEIVPEVKGIRVRPAKVKKERERSLSIDGKQFSYNEGIELTGNELIFDTTASKAIPASSMGDGTLLALGILTLFQYKVDQSIILIDDIEHGLHPIAQRRLIQMLAKLAEKQNKQILFTTHSPYVLDVLDAKDVWVMSKDQEGISHCKRLSDHPDSKHALEVLTTGELWDAEGEQWVTGETETMEPAHA
ncbi:MAG: ATP-binding protein [Acidobacteria bacterium]|nr:ATP-binding protein [Acidobacteriota bacterium]MBI3427426.1 ATP-binding protein [Acidobacteriota bacterium]